MQADNYRIKLFCVKPLFSLILIVVIACNVWAWQLLFQKTKYEIRKEQRELLLAGIPDEQVEIIIIPNILADKKHAPNFKRVKDWEICYQGKMFDFSKEERLKDSTVFYGITDHKENKLLADVKESLKNSHRVPLSKSPIPHFYNFLLDIHAVISQKRNCRLVLDAKFLKQNNRISPLISRQRKPETPPPQSLG